jgi:hypothetical protein
MLEEVAVVPDRNGSIVIEVGRIRAREEGSIRDTPEEGQRICQGQLAIAIEISPNEWRLREDIH